MPLKIGKKDKQPKKLRDTALVALETINAEAAERFITDEIPSTLKEALNMDPNSLVQASARLHTLMSHWSARFAYAKGRHSAAELARKTVRSRIKSIVRATQQLPGGKNLTESAITEQAERSSEYIDMCRAQVEAEVEYLKYKGLVDAIIAKREALRMISYYIKPEMDMATYKAAAYLEEDDDFDTSEHDRVMRDAHKMMKEKNWG